MCSYNTSFLAGDVFFSNALHVLSFFEIPLHIFGAFIVLTRTPQKMATVKKNMMILHCAGAISDIYLSLIAGPSLAVPLCAGYPLGVSVWLGIPTDVQVYIGFTLACGVAVAILAFFEDRFHVLGNGVSSSTSWLRRAHIGVMYLFAAAFMFPAYLAIPNQDEGKAEVLRQIPCYPPELLDRPGFFVLTVNSTIFLYCFATMVSLTHSQLLIYAAAIVYRLFHAGCKSKNLIRLQKQFMMALGIQVVIPVVVLVIPAGYIGVAVYTGYYNQAVTNIAVLLVALHGLASTVTMLIVHKPYRQASLEVLQLMISKQKNATANGSNSFRTSIVAL